MLKGEFNERITAIGASENLAEIREMLTQLSDDVSLDYDRQAELQTQNETLLSDNESLRQANMKLFLRVGESKSEAETVKSNTGIDRAENQKRSFENLFNEKGELK